MRRHGTLTRWNPERGFGFITPAEGGDPVFVHVTAFPRDGRQPVVGERVSFELEASADGKARAVRVLRPGQAGHRGTPARSRPGRPATGRPRDYQRTRDDEAQAARLAQAREGMPAFRYLSPTGS